jgi:small subunit ribosomal protein S29e
MIPNPDIRVLPHTTHLHSASYTSIHVFFSINPPLSSAVSPRQPANNTGEKTSTCPTNQSGTPVPEPTARALAAGMSILKEIYLEGIDADNSVVTGDRKKSGIIRKYGLNMSRQAFREKAQDIGFVKVCVIQGRKEGVWVDEV